MHLPCYCCSFCWEPLFPPESDIRKSYRLSNNAGMSAYFQFEHHYREFGHMLSKRQVCRIGQAYDTGIFSIDNVGNMMLSSKGKRLRESRHAVGKGLIFAENARVFDSALFGHLLTIPDLIFGHLRPFLASQRFPMSGWILDAPSWSTRSTLWCSVIIPKLSIKNMAVPCAGQNPHTRCLFKMRQNSQLRCSNRKNFDVPSWAFSYLLQWYRLCCEIG